MRDDTPPPEPAEEPTPAHDSPILPRLLTWDILVAIGLAIWLSDVWLGLRPEGVQPWGWRLLAIFVPTILGLMLRPLPGGAIVFLAIILVLILDALPPRPDWLPKELHGLWPYQQALGGYMNSSVWLVLAAFFIARALIKTGLARRIALTFVRLLGSNTLGLSYALLATDALLAGMIPSNAARVGGVLLPITRSLAELYRSRPGRSAGLLGSFLMLTLYQGDVVACAMFYTGQSSNPLAAAQAKELTGQTVQLHYANWLLYASAPGIVSLLLVPYLVYRFNRPAITHTPEAVGMARAELLQMGRPGFGETVVLLVFAGVCLTWIILGFVPDGGQYITVAALAGAGILFLSGVLTWEDAITERGAWDVFIWYGGLVQLGTLLKDAQVIRVFAEAVAANLKLLPLALLFVVVLLIYFYAHYGFASITVHILSMYPAFVGVLLTLGAPPWLVIVCFACFSNLCAGLTNYGTTHAPIIFSTGYVSHGTWWRVGFLMSLVNIVIWLAVGLAWWKLWGLW